MMIVRGSVTYDKVLIALGAKSIPSLEWERDDEIVFNDVEIDESTIDIECEECHGEGCPEPDAIVNPWLIGDFIRAIQTGDIHTAQQLVGRVFDVAPDVTLVEHELCRCAA